MARHIRELRNFCERLAVLWDGGSIVNANALSEFLFYGDACAPSPPSDVPLDDTLDLASIQEALDVAHGNKTHAAQPLGVSRVTLWRQLKKLHEEG